MEQQSRPFSKVEKQQLRIAKKMAEKTLLEKFNWGSFFILGFVSILFLYFSYATFFWLWIVITLILLTVLVNIPYNFRAKKRVAMQRYDLVDDYLLKDRVEVERYECSNAIVFELDDGKGKWYVLEINEEELLFYNSIFEYETGLPNTQFEIYAEEAIEDLFGHTVNTTGLSIKPVVIIAELTKEVLDIFPEHKSIIKGTVESYLDDIEEYCLEH